MQVDLIADLNSQQREAAEYGVREPGAVGGPLLVVAGAGTGKTMTLAARVARLVLAGADPRRILLLTFSRRAAREMERRCGALLQRALGLGHGRPPPELPWAGTFHAVGARLLREHAASLGLSESFTVLDRGDAEDLMGMVRHELGLSRTASRFPLKGTCLAIYSRAVNSTASLPEVLAGAFPWCAQWEADLRRLFAAYVDHKLQQQVLDYDDLLLCWAQLMQDATLAQRVRERFDHVLVDEYQDTNRLQAELLRALAPDGRGLTVVGDDAQSIYSFRSAEVGNILDFASQFAPPARVVTLERNYRSTQPILDASNALIAAAVRRHHKQLWTDRASSHRPLLVTVADDLDQARWVAERVLALREEGVVLKQQAVLFRSSHHSAALELELARRGIPFVKFGGLKFLEAAHIKDVLSVLRLAQNPRGRLSALRAAQLVPGLGPAAARRLADALQGGTDPWGELRAFAPPKAAAHDWRELVALLESLNADSIGWPEELRQASRWYQPHLERLHADAAVRAGDLAQLAAIAAGYPSRERFLTELTLDPPEATSANAEDPSLDEDYLILSTIHSAKGQEWTAVSVLNVVDGCIPSDMAAGHVDEVEEERRLLYVAMTRARHHLHLLVPQRFYVTQQGSHGDRHVYGGLSRFVDEAVMAHCDRVGPGREPECGSDSRSSAAAVPSAHNAALGRASAGTAAHELPAIDLAAKLRQRWG